MFCERLFVTLVSLGVAAAVRLSLSVCVGLRPERVEELNSFIHSSEHCEQ